MQVSYGQVKGRSAAVAAAIADARSARNLASRRRAEDARDEREAAYHRRRRKRKSDQELEELLCRVVRIKVPKDERPRIGASTARNLYHRTVDRLVGATGLTDARGPDRLYSIHFAFTPRGFASTQGRRWRGGEAERAARYIVREDGLEGGECGWWSNIAADRNELVAFYRALEELERHDRSNANVYVSEIIALPFELNARQRRKAVRRICRFFDQRGLPYTVAIHLPDEAGDQRNHHVHILYSLRSCTRNEPYDWSFGVAKADDINTPDGIKSRRMAVVQAINTTLRAAGLAKRYTHLSNKSRGMAAGQAKVGQEATWIERRLKALEDRAAELRRLSGIVARLRKGLRPTGLRLQRQKAVAAERLAELCRKVGAAVSNSRPAELTNIARERLADNAQSVLRDAKNAVEAIGATKAGAAARLENMAAELESRQTEQLGRLAKLAATAKVREEHARLLEQKTAVRELLVGIEESMAEARTAVASSLAAMEERIEREITGRATRLANLARIAERMETSDRLDAIGTAVGISMSNTTARLLKATNAVRDRLERLEPGTRPSKDQTERLALLSGVAERRHLEDQQAAPGGDPDRSSASIDDGSVSAPQHEVPAMVPAGRVATQDGRRGSERRKAVAAAAWQLRRSSFPPQVRTKTGFAIWPNSVSGYRDADRFEAEAVIQKIHLAKRAQMLAAVRRRIQGAERSPLTERDGSIRVRAEIFDQPLRSAVTLAAKDTDLFEVLQQSLLFWREREIVEHKAKERKKREADERRNRMRPGVQKVYDAIKRRVHDGRYPMTAIAAIREDVMAVATAIGDGRLAMRISSGGRQFYCGSDELRITLAELGTSRIGREIVEALGQITIEEPFEPEELSVGWILPSTVPPQGVPPGEEVGITFVPGKGGAER